MRLTFVEFALAETVHPAEGFSPGERCTHCVVAVDDRGARYLLWGAYSDDPEQMHWSLNRADPRWGTNERVDNIELIFPKELSTC